MQLLRRHRKLGNLAKIISIFSDLYDSENNILPLQITTAGPLAAEQKKRLLEKLEKKLAQKIEPVFVTAADLIGGIRISGPDWLIDNSVAKHLEKIRD